MAFLTISCPTNVLVQLDNNSCTANVDIPEPTSNCAITSITNDFNNMSSIPAQDFGPGSFVVTWTLVDCNDTTTCTQTVTVIDNTAPMFVCPPADAQMCAASDMTAFASVQELIDAGATISDNCEIDMAFIQAGDLVVVNAGPCPAEYERTYTIRDVAGNTATCMHSIIVDDTTSPVFDCPTDITIAADEGACTANMPVPSISATDNCGTVTLTNDISMSGPFDFPIGQTAITYTATDDCGNTSTCMTFITVVDTEMPTMTCPAGLTAACSASEQAPYSDYAAFVAAGGMATDNCGLNEASFTMVSDTPQGTTCPVTVERVYQIADQSGNIAMCTQLIVVSETEAPSFTAPADISVDCGVDISDLTLVGSATNIMDNCGADNVAMSYSDVEITAACPNIMTIERTWSAIDSCNNMSNTQVQLIHIQDTIAPNVVCQDITVYLNPSGDVDFMPELLDAGTADNCGSPVTFSSNFEFAACNDITTFTNIILRATDSCGNVDSCTASVTILDTLPPSLTCPNAISVACPTDVPAAYSTYIDFNNDGGQFQDNCETDVPVLFTLNSEVQTGTVCPYDIVRTYYAEDNNGNGDSCQHIITVNDTTLPSFTCPADRTITGTMNTCDTLLTITELTASDPCGIASISNDFNSGGADASGVYPAGETVVTYTITDNCGNVATCAMTITVVSDPAFTCPADITLECTLTGHPVATSFAAFVAQGGSANLGCDLDTNTFTLMEEVLVSSDACTQIVDRTYAVSGMMDMFTCTQRVTATDETLPEITCPATINVNSEIDQCGANVTLTPTASSDNCGIQNITNAGSAFYPVGDHTVILTATDFCGNTATCSVDIMVNDAQAPEITCPDPATAMCDPSMISTYMTADEFLAAGGQLSDNCGIDESTFTFVTEGNMTIFGMTFFMREYSIQDIYGNSGTCFHTILLMDSTEPVVTCPDDIVVQATAAECEAMVSVVATSNDNCGAESISHTLSGALTSPGPVDGADASGIYPVGVTTVTFVATDADGNTNSCQMTVTVQDITDPEFSCPSPITASCDISNLAPYTQWFEFENDGGSANDICGIDTNSLEMVLQTGPVGTCPKVYTRTYRLEDNNGNFATCEQTIEINDTEAPTLICPANITMGTDEGVCEAQVSVILSIVNDNCGIQTITNSQNNGAADASDTYPIGDTDVTFTVTDSCGLTSTCTMTITVVDDEDPVITLGTGAAGATLNAICSASEIPTLTLNEFEAAGGSVSDNCTVDRPTFTHQGDVAVVGSNPSTVIRTYQVEDEAGNVGTITQNIIVEDDIAPELTIPADITVDCLVDIDDLAITGMPSATDNCTGTINNIPHTDELNQQGSCISDAVTLRIFVAVDDAGNEARDTQRITRIDDTAPEITYTSRVTATQASVITDSIACNADFPPIEKVIASDLCSGFGYEVDTLFVENVCAGYPVYYQYTVIDDCGNQATAYSAFFVKADTADPVVVSHEANIELNTDQGLCTATATVPAPQVSDECSQVTIANNMDGNAELTYEFPIGETIVSYTITDACGNMTVIDQIVNVTDNEAPTITCKGQAEVIALSSDESIVYASSFYEEANDNCGNVTVEVRKVNDACGVADNTVYGDQLTFCCAEIGQTLEVEVRVTDAAGLINVCTTTATIVDNVKPTKMIPIPNVTVSCDYPIDIEDMSEFGTFVEISEPRADIIVNDVLHQGTGFVVGQDGVYKDNCPAGSSVSVQVIDQRVNGQGNIMRQFTISDASGNLEFHTQVITVTDVNPFTENDITWPMDVTVEGCENGIPTTEEAGVPTFTNINACHNIQYSHNDLVFDVPSSGCVYVRRTFTVINTYEYDPNDSSSGGSWSKIQNIFIDNNVAPEFTGQTCVDTTICAQGSGCSALVELTATATDDCTAAEDLIYLYSIDLNNDGTTDITGEGNTISQMMQQGVHAVTWKVKDRCTNDTTCTQLVTVRECKLPTPVCLSVAADLSPATGELSIWASDFDAGSFDNCTDKEDLIFSFSSDVNDFGRTYTCDSIGIRTIQMWVTDEAGNQDFCVATIEVQDNTGFCNGSNLSSNITGVVLTSQEVPLANTKVLIEGPEMEKEYMTDENGGYVFEGLPMYNDYSIRPEKNDDHRRGVSTMDVVLIQRHIIGKQPFDSPYNIIAADVNNNEKITASDVVELRKLVLGVTNDFNNNNSFRFVDSDYQFFDTEKPFPFDEEVEVESLNQDNMVTDFVAVKIGDVNNSFEDELRAEDSDTRSAQSILLRTSDQFIKAGERLSIPIRTADLNAIYAMQFTMDYDDDILTYEGYTAGALPLLDNHIAEHRSAITLAYGNDEPVENIASDSDLFYLVFTVKQDAKLSKVLSLSSDITPAWTYDNAQQEYDTYIRFDTKDSDFLVAQNQPNPFSEYTDIVFELPVGTHVELTVYDNSGKLIYRQADKYESGYNTIRINKEQLNGSGVYYYKIKTDRNSETRKMLKID